MASMWSNALHGKRATIVLLAKILFVLTLVGAILHIFSTPISTWADEHRAAFSSHGKPVVLNSVNVAAIIEDRPLSNLAPLLLHFSSVLGPDWPIVLFTNPWKNPLLDASAPFQRAVVEGRIVIKALPRDTHFSDHAAVSKLLTEAWLWEQLAPAGHVLLFQADSILCSNSKLRMEQFLHYDFVGAPIDTSAEGNAGHGEGLNGGLSLRNRTMVLDIIKHNSWQGEKDDGTISQGPCNTKAPCLKFEDQWYYSKMKALGGRFPSFEVAKTFAVETVWYDTPLGFHQVERWIGGEMEKVIEWCPEYKMVTTHGIAW